MSSNIIMQQQQQQQQALSTQEKEQQGTTSTTSINNNDDDQPDAELVSEFPPPPYYYKLFTQGQQQPLAPPPIPKEAIERSTRQSIRKRATLDMEERNRLGGLGVGVIGGGGVGDLPDFNGGGKMDGPTIAIFGQDNYLEDPNLVSIPDDFSDPQEVKAEVSRLNKEILQGFMTLVGVLVNSPMDQGPCREQLMKNIEQLLKECNKFREHQARECMIQTLEKQLLDRTNAVRELRNQILEANQFLMELAVSSDSEVDDNKSIR